MPRGRLSSAGPEVGTEAPWRPNLGAPSQKRTRKRADKQDRASTLRGEPQRRTTSARSRAATPLAPLTGLTSTRSTRDARIALLPPWSAASQRSCRRV